MNNLQRAALQKQSKMIEHNYQAKLARIKPSNGLAPIRDERIIVMEQFGYTEECLSMFLEIGRMYHGYCQHYHIERTEYGYYHYERQEEYKTDAIAAMYAGAFGKKSVERTDTFSMSQAIYQLSERLNIDLFRVRLPSPINQNAIVDVMNECNNLVAIDGWTRAGVANWLRKNGL